MFSELAYKNVRRSMKDYLIYFLTLSFGVCLFYMFNSIDAQAAMMKLTAAQANYMQTLAKSIDYISVFISVILGFLVVYANGFLIKRRKKELGLYLTLGMDKSRLARLLMLETLFIGLFALAVGLVAGIFAAQGFSVVTAHMFTLRASTSSSPVRRSKRRCSTSASSFLSSWSSTASPFRASSSSIF